MTNLETLQNAFDSLADWEKEIFLNNNAEQLLAYMTIPVGKPNLDDIETEDIAEWLIESGMVTCDELLDAVVDDIDKLREIMYDSAVMDYESQEEILDEDEYYGTAEPSSDFEIDEDFPY